MSSDLMPRPAITTKQRPGRPRQAVDKNGGRAWAQDRELRLPFSVQHVSRPYQQAAIL